MSELIADTPWLQVMVRSEFFYNHESHAGEFTPAVMFGVRAEPAAVPMFQVLLDSGAQWARVPIHMLCTKPCDPLPLAQTCWWDCYGYSFTLHAFGMLRNHAVTARGRDGILRHGRYLFTLDWMQSGWSETPNQHKNHHVIVLDTGHLIAYPNNALQWIDSSWITGTPDRSWVTSQQTYTVE